MEAARGLTMEVDEKAADVQVKAQTKMEREAEKAAEGPGRAIGRQQKMQERMIGADIEAYDPTIGHQAAMRAGAEAAALMRRQVPQQVAMWAAYTSVMDQIINGQVQMEHRIQELMMRINGFQGKMGAANHAARNAANGPEQLMSLDSVLTIAGTSYTRVTSCVDAYVERVFGSRRAVMMPSLGPSSVAVPSRRGVMGKRQRWTSIKVPAWSATSRVRSPISRASQCIRLDARIHGAWVEVLGRSNSRHGDRWNRVRDLQPQSQRGRVLCGLRRGSERRDDHFAYSSDHRDSDGPQRRGDRW